MKLTEKKRENIIEAAIIEFRQQGFSSANMARIAKRAAVSTRTLYKHFESKEELFDAICVIMMARNSVMGPVSFDPGIGLAEQLVAALERYVDVITDPEVMGLNRLVISELLRDLEQSRAFFAQTAAHDYPVTQLIAEAMAAGALRQADPAYASNQLLGLVKNFFFWPEFMLGTKQAGRQTMEDCVAMFLSHYEPG